MTEKKDDIENETEGEADRVQSALAGLRPGYSVTVYRVRPSWCKGWLEKVDYVDGEAIDMEYLVKQWGGEVLRVRITDERGKYVQGGQADVPLYSYPPRFHGRILEAPHDEPIPYSKQSPEDRFRQAQAQFLPQAAPNPLDSAASLAALIKQLSESQQKGLTNYIDFLTRTAPQPAPQSFGGIEQVMQLARAWQQLQGIFGAAQAAQAAPAPITSGDDFLPYLTDIIKTVLQKDPGRKGPAAPATSAISARSPVVAPRPRPIPMPQPAAPAPAPDKIGDIARTIAALDPEDAADAIAGAFGLMEESRRAIAIPRFMSIVSGEEEGEEDDDEEEDDDDGDDNQIDAEPIKDR